MTMFLQVFMWLCVCVWSDDSRTEQPRIAPMLHVRRYVNQRTGEVVPSGCEREGRVARYSRWEWATRVERKSRVARRLFVYCARSKRNQFGVYIAHIYTILGGTVS